MLDFICRPLGMFLKLIYDTIAFNNYGLAIIVFTIIVRAAMLPLTIKQQKASLKMQELQPLVNKIQKRYKDDKEKLNQELMKLYQEHNYNPMGGCLPLLIQFPLIISLYWVIVQPLKFMLGKSEEAITKILEVAASALGKTVAQLGTQKEMVALNFFHENPGELSKVAGLLDKSELIDFNNFLGLRLGEFASYKPADLFGENAGIYIPLFLLVIVATVTTYFSAKLAMPKTLTNDKQESPAGCSNNSFLYMGPVMTLVVGFQMPAGVVLYWMTGYVVGILQQLYINKYIKKKTSADATDDKTLKGAADVLEIGSGDNAADDKSSGDNSSGDKAAGDKTSGNAKNAKKSPGSGQGRGKKKGGKKK